MNMTPQQRRESRLEQTYGITEEQFDTMLRSQNGGCAICGNAAPPGHYLVVDHNHETGQVRALLCSECNTGIGLLGDNPLVVLAAVKYLLQHGVYGGATQLPPAVVQTHPDLQEAAIVSKGARNNVNPQ